MTQPTRRHCGPPASDALRDWSASVATTRQPADLDRRRRPRPASSRVALCRSPRGRGIGRFVARRRSRCLEPDPSHLLQRPRAGGAHVGGETPPFVDEARTNHVVVMGLGQLGRNLVVAVAQAWADRPGDEPLPITLVDRVASGRWAAMCMQHPALRECVRQRCSISISAPRADEVQRLREAVTELQPTWVCMAFADESLALSTALLAQRELGIGTAPIVVRTRSESGLGALIHGHTSAGSQQPADLPLPRAHVHGAVVDAGEPRATARPSTSSTSPHHRHGRLPPICGGRGMTSSMNNVIRADGASMV